MAALGQVSVLPAPTFRQCGFTLTEMAVVLAIVALLIGGMLMPLGTQQDFRAVTETDAVLKNAHEALLGFAAANGRLPCPAAPNETGIEKFATGQDATTGECANFLNGFLPAITLGVRPTDSNGYAIDAWGHRLRYSVSDTTINAVTRAITRIDGIKFAGLGNVATMPMLAVCTTATGIDPGDTSAPIEYCGTATALVTAAPAVLYSTGKNDVGSGADEQANATADPVFISHDPTPASAANGEFDDRVTWLSINLLANRLLSAGRLP